MGNFKRLLECQVVQRTVCPKLSISVRGKLEDTSNDANLRHCLKYCDERRVVCDSHEKLTPENLHLVTIPKFI